MNATTNTVRMSKGSNKVNFTIVKGQAKATMSNSRGEFRVMTLDEARTRIANLLTDGWEVRAV